MKENGSVRTAHCVWAAAGLALAGGVLIHGARASACSLCGSGDPLVDASNSVPGSSALRLALDFEYVSASAASDDTAGATESVDQIMLRPVVVYSPMSRLNLIAQIPLLRKHFTLTGGGANEVDTPIGIGDISLGARWLLWQRRNWHALSRQNFGITAGVNLPTGPNDAKSDGMRIDDHAQLGRGSFGPYAGISYAYHRDPWNTFASVTVTAHTTNSYMYHYGTGVQWTLREDWRPWERVALELGADGRYAGQDDIGGDTQVNTGGLLLSAAPGVAVNVTGNVWLNARAEIPVYSHLYGTQSVGVTTFASVQMLIQ